MSLYQSINFVPRVPWLADKARNVYTQFGEDGLIESVFDRIGETNRQCFECGAADGRFFSNTLRLREQGWESLLIESDAEQYNRLLDAYGSESICIRDKCENLDRHLSVTGFDTRLDFGVIDIDGQDWWLWHNMIQHKPRVMLVEISTAGVDEPIPLFGGIGQAGLNSIRSLGEAKGYELVATTFCNALFICP